MENSSRDYLKFLEEKNKTKKEEKDFNLGWISFLFFLFIVAYAYFAFVYFK